MSDLVWQFNEAVSLLREARPYCPHALREEIAEGLDAMQEALKAAASSPGGHPVEGGDADELFKWLLEIGEVELRVGYGSDSTDLFCRYVSTSMVRVPRSQWEHLL